MGYFLKGPDNKCHVRTEVAAHAIAVAAATGYVSVATASASDIFIASLTHDVYNNSGTEPCEPITDVTGIDIKLNVESDEYDQYGFISTDRVPIRHGLSLKVTKKVRGLEWCAISVGDGAGNVGLYGLNPTDNTLTCFEASVDVGTSYGYRVVTVLGRISATKYLYLVGFNAIIAGHTIDISNPAALHTEDIEFRCNAGAYLISTSTAAAFAMTARGL